MIRLKVAEVLPHPLGFAFMAGRSDQCGFVLIEPAQGWTKNGSFLSAIRTLRDDVSIM
jgi:hypothetical protein